MSETTSAPSSREDEPWYVSVSHKVFVHHLTIQYSMLRSSIAIPSTPLFHFAHPSIVAPPLSFFHYPSALHVFALLTPFSVIVICNMRVVFRKPSYIALCVVKRLDDVAKTSAR